MTGSILQYFRQILIRLAAGRIPVTIYPSAGWIVIHPAAGVYFFARPVNYTEGCKIDISEEKLAFSFFWKIQCLLNMPVNLGL